MILNFFNKIFTDIDCLFAFLEKNILEKYKKCTGCCDISIIKIFKRSETKN